MGGRLKRGVKRGEHDKKVVKDLFILAIPAKMLFLCGWISA